MKADVVKKVDNTRELVQNSELHPDSKELLYSLLDTAAESANGTPDKLQAIGDTLLSFCLYEIRSAVRFPVQLNQAAADAVKAHTDNCPMRNAAIGMPRVASWLFPFRWQLCVLLCIVFLAPNAPNILQSIVKLITSITS